MEQWKKVAWSDESCFLLHHMDGKGTQGTRMHYGKKASCETLGLAIHVDVSYLSIVLWKRYSLVAVACFGRIMHPAKMVQEWFEEHK